jgi:opacity protein-like surface antigen
MRFTLIIAASLLFLPLQASGLEVTPMIGYTFGGEVRSETDEKLTFDEGGSFALAVDFDLVEADKQIELFWSHQQTRLSGNDNAKIFDTKIDYLHIGGTVQYPQNGYVPFIAGGFGATHFSPDDGYKAETRFSISVGGGIKAFITKQVGLRLEGRGYVTFMPTEGSIFCGGDSDGCTVMASGDALFVFQGLAGVFLRF